MARHQEVGRRAVCPLESERHADAVVLAHVLGKAHHHLQQLLEIDARRLLPLQLGIKPTGVGNIGNEAVQTFHVVLDHVHQTVARGVALGERQRLHRAAQGGERVLEFVRHVGGEALDGLDAIVKGAGHVAQGAGEMADLVRAGGEIRDLHPRLDTPAHPFGRRRELAHRIGDGAGEQHREQHHHHRRHQEHAHDDEALGLHRRVDLAALGGQKQHAEDGAEALDRHGDGNHHLSALVHPHLAGLHAHGG